MAKTITKQDCTCPTCGEVHEVVREEVYGG